MRSFHSLATLRQMRIERGAQAGEKIGQGIPEIAILALAEAVPGHVDMAAEMLLMGIERRDLPRTRPASAACR